MSECQFTCDDCKYFKEGVNWDDGYATWYEDPECENEKSLFYYKDISSCHKICNEFKEAC